MGGQPRGAHLALDACVAQLLLAVEEEQAGRPEQAEYDTIAAIKAAVGIPVFANGDIDSPEKAAAVLDYTGADAVMVGRGAQGNPWIFREIDHYLRHGERLAPPADEERAAVLRDHLTALHDFYGEHMGVRIARKHVGWYLAGDTRLTAERQRDYKATFNGLDSAAAQHRFIDDCFRHAPLEAAAPKREGMTSKGTRAA